MLVTIEYTDLNNNDKEVYRVLTSSDNIRIVETRCTGDYYIKDKYTTFYIKNHTELNKLLHQINLTTPHGAEVIDITSDKNQPNFLRRLFRKFKSKKTFVGYVIQYSDCRLFETETDSYSQQVCVAVDELMGELSKDGDRFKITIEKIERD